MQLTMSHFKALKRSKTWTTKVDNRHESNGAEFEAGSCTEFAGSLPASASSGAELPNF
jgi:hypothetical protein